MQHRLPSLARPCANALDAAPRTLGRIAKRGNMLGRRTNLLRGIKSLGIIRLTP
jgi:hypothetical protein